MSWEGLKYQPVKGFFERVQRRIARSQRRAMLQMFVERGLSDFAAKVKQLRDNVRRRGEWKMTKIQRILDDYSKLISRATAESAGQTPSATEPGLVGVPSA